MSQCASIWAWMADGHTITPAQAYEKFGTLALHSRITELRERGHKINTEMIDVNGKRVGRYSLVSSFERAA